MRKTSFGIEEEEMRRVPQGVAVRRRCFFNTFKKDREGFRCLHDLLWRACKANDPRVEEWHVFCKDAGRVAFGINRYENRLDLTRLVPETIHHGRHLRQRSWANVRTICEAEKDKHPAPREIIFCLDHALMVSQFKGCLES